MALSYFRRESQPKEFDQLQLQALYLQHWLYPLSSRFLRCQGQSQSNQVDQLPKHELQALHPDPSGYALEVASTKN